MTPRTSARLAIGLAVVAAVAALVAVSVSRSPTRVRTLVGAPGASLVPAAEAPAAPEFAGVKDWLNSPPLTVSGLRGRVVLVDFWTYSCINCRRTLPFLRALSTTYAPAGLTVVGVHTPEFDFEKSTANVARAVRELHVSWPVAEDPDRATWDAYANQYWPADYLVDRAGRVRLVHFGEGDDDAIETAVRTLLDEGGSAGAQHVGPVAATEQPPSPLADITPELYLGSARHRASDPLKVSGPTTTTEEWVELRAGAKVVLDFRARDVYAVIAPGAGGLAAIGLELDGRALPDQRVTADDLLHLAHLSEVATGRLTLVARAPGVRLFTFTFGG